MAGYSRLSYGDGDDDDAVDLRGSFFSLRGADDTGKARAAAAAAQRNHSVATGSSIGACVALLSNTILGVSIVGFAHAFAETGYLLGSIFTVMFACFSANGLHLLACSARTVGKYPCSFYTVAHAAAPDWTVSIDFAIAVKCFGVATSYLIVIGDLMPAVIEGMWAGGPEAGPDVLRSRRFWVSMGLAVVAPLAFARRLGALRYTAALSVSFVLFLVGIVVAYAVDPHLDACPQSHESCFTTSSAVGRPVHVLKVLSVFVFGYTCHQNIFTICNEMANPSPARVDLAIFVSIFIAASSYGLLAWSAYATFGESIRPDILETYPQSRLVTAARACVSLLVAFCYPLQAHPSRRSITSMLAVVRARRRKDEPIYITVDGQGGVAGGGTKAALQNLNGGTPSAPPWTPPKDPTWDPVTEPWPTVPGPAEAAEPGLLQHAAITTLFLGLSYAIAMTVSDLGVVLEVVGATGSTVISYILPGLVYFKLHPWWHVKRVLALVQLCVGCTIVPLCLTFIFVRIAE